MNDATSVVAQGLSGAPPLIGHDPRALTPIFAPAVELPGCDAAFFLPDSGGSLDSYLGAQENERLRIGRELHDSTGQLLVVLSLNIGRLREARMMDDAEALFSETEEIVREIDKAIRILSYVNFPAELGPLGLASALDG